MSSARPDASLVDILRAVSRWDQAWHARIDAANSDDPGRNSREARDTASGWFAKAEAELHSVAWHADKVLADIDPQPAPCPFCKRIAAGDVERKWPAAVAFTPLNPVTPGHMLVVPIQHVPDAAANPIVSSLTMAAASELAAEIGDCNIITSLGAAATQTVPHLHLHVVPRHAGDGLMLPWTGQGR